MNKYFKSFLIIFFFFLICSTSFSQGINAGGGINIPSTSGTTITPQTCSAGQAITAAAADGTFTCGTIGGGGSSRGVFASAPTCNAGANNTTYFTTDAGLIGQCNGTAWKWFYGQIPVVPTSTSGSALWLNENTGNALATAVNNTSGAGVLFTGGSSSSVLVQARLRVAPATPYTYVVCMNALSGAFAAQLGVAWTNGNTAGGGGSKISASSMFSRYASNESAPLVWENYTDTGTSSAQYAVSFGVRSDADPTTPMCWALVDNGTNRKIGWSYNRTDWITGNYPAVSRTDFLTPTHVGYFVNSNTGQSKIYVNIFSEEVVASALF